METESTKSQYLLLFRGSHWDKGLSPEELQKGMDKFTAWFEKLQCKLKSGQALEQEGRLVSGRNGSVVSDGPFAESKEAIGGYFLLELDSFEEALAIAKGCPFLQYGSSIEVRPIAAECATMTRVKERLAVAAA